MEDIDVIVLFTFMEDIDVFCFVYIYGGYRCIYGGFDVVRFVYIYGGYRCSSFCLHLWRISMYFRFVYIYVGYRCRILYFRLFTFMEDIDVICFVYIYGGYRCNLFCLHLWRISM